MPQLLALEAREQGFRIELVLLDDGSQYGSFERLREQQAMNPSRIKVAKLTRELGSMSAI